MIKDIELLAPVGSMESLYAAVENGCNAVYLGGANYLVLVSMQIILI